MSEPTQFYEPQEISVISRIVEFCMNNNITLEWHMDLDYRGDTCYMFEFRKPKQKLNYRITCKPKDIKDRPESMCASILSKICDIYGINPLDEIKVKQPMKLKLYINHKKRMLKNDFFIGLTKEENNKFDTLTTENHVDMYVRELLKKYLK